MKIERKKHMRKFVISVAFALAATGLSAGSMEAPVMEDMAEPMMEPEMMEPTGMSTNTILLLLLALGAVGYAISR